MRARGVVRRGVLVAALLAVPLILTQTGPAYGDHQPQGYAVSAAIPNITLSPVISGTPTEGSTLTCSEGTWSGNPQSFAFAWTRDDVAIAGATSATYVVTATDLHTALRCVVTATADDGSNSAPSAPVVAGLPGPCANPQTGTSGRDSIRGTKLGDRLRGLAGRDLLVGFQGDDCVLGGTGDDRLIGGPGDDVLRGQAGKDDIRASGGDDRVVGGGGADVLQGGPGDDFIKARDGRRDVVACGPGRDQVRADRVDQLTGCEVRVT